MSIRKLNKLSKLFQEAKKERTMKSVKRVFNYINDLDISKFNIVQKTEILLYCDLLVQLRNDLIPRVAA